MIRRYFIATLITLFGGFQAFAQDDCLQKFDAANRAYYEGRVRDIDKLLRPCLNQNTFEKDVRIEALRLIINSYIILQEPDSIDSNMRQLLTLDPEYEVRSNDLIEFKEEKNEYKIIPAFNVGIIAGATIPSYTILRYHSYASETLEPNSYESFSGLQIGLNADIRLFHTVYLNTGLTYSSYGLRQEEVILNYQRVSSREENRVLNLPFQLRYIHEGCKFKPFVGAGINLNFLLASNSEIDHVPLAPTVNTPFGGVPQSDRSYSLTGIKNRFTYSLLFSAGVQRKINRSTLELRVSYDYGVANVIDESKRYTDQTLLEKFAYVPDDYKVDLLNISFSYYLTFAKPIRK